MHAVAEIIPNLPDTEIQNVDAAPSAQPRRAHPRAPDRARGRRAHGCRPQGRAPRAPRRKGRAHRRPARPTRVGALCPALGSGRPRAGAGACHAAQERDRQRATAARPGTAGLCRVRRKADTSPYVFTSERRGSLTDSTVRKMAARAARLLAGLPFPVHPHMLRTPAGSSWPTMATIPRRCSTTSGIGTFSTRCATRRWRQCGSGVLEGLTAGMSRNAAAQADHGHAGGDRGIGLRLRRRG